MKKITVSFVLVLMCIMQLNVFAAASFGNIETTTINSEVLGEQRQLVVYLPANYAGSAQKFPVLYLTDGDVHGAHTAGTIDFLSKVDQAPSMIVVGIVNPRNTREQELTLVKTGDHQPAALAGADRFLHFLELEVIPQIKSRYRTLDYQVLSGTSHGGQFGINALVKRPGLFDGVIAISPSLYWNNNQLVALAQDALKQQTLVGHLFMSIANEEPIMTAPFNKLAEFAAKYPIAALKVATKTLSDESHDSTTLLGQYYGLKHLFSNWAIPNSPQTLADLQAVYSARSQLLGDTMIIPEDRASGYAQWLQYLDRKDDALALLIWNRQNYPQSFNAHAALIKAYLHFKLIAEAKSAVEAALLSLQGLSSEQKEQLKSLLI